MWRDVIILALGIGFLVFAGYVGFWTGRDSAQRQAFYTISNLRRTVSQLRLENERLSEHNRRVTHAVNTARNVDVEVPPWMQ